MTPTLPNKNAGNRKTLQAFIVEFPNRTHQARETHIAESHDALDAWINDREGNRGDHVITLVQSEEQLGVSRG